jgi:hypothetical protein
MSTQSFTLNTGASIPAVAFGGWGGLTHDEREALKLVLIDALQVVTYPMDQIERY